MTFRKMLVASLAAVVMLAGASSVLAVDTQSLGTAVRAEKEADIAGVPGDRNDCTAPYGPVGIVAGGLPAVTFVGDNTGGGNNFGIADSGLCSGSGYGGTGDDDVWAFTVDTCGVYTFETGCLGLGFMGGDTSLQVRSGAVCVSSSVIACNGDACAGYASLTSAQLNAGAPFWLVVDSYSPGYVGAYGVAVHYAPPAGPCCTQDSDCDDGLYCTGVETCNLATGICNAGAGNPCVAPTNICVEATDSCVGCSSDADCTNPALPYCLGGACVRCLNDGHCNDGLFCNGVETCSQTNTCVAGPGNPCGAYPGPSLLSCNETTDTCDGPGCISWRAEGTLTGSFSPQAFNACVNAGQGDDIQLRSGAGRELISYKTLTQARNLAGNPNCTFGAAPPIPCAVEAVGTPYSVTVELWTVASGGSCLPDAPIAGTACTLSPGVVAPGGTGGDAVVCAPNGGLPTGIMLPDGDDDSVMGQCGVDVYLMVYTANGGVGPSINGAVDIGGTAMDDEFGQTVFVTPNCLTDGSHDGTWGFGAFSAPTLSNFRVTEICTVPEGPCCTVAQNGDGVCSRLSSDACQAAGGSYMGDDTADAPKTCDSPDGDGDGLRDECDLCPQDGTKVGPGQCGCGNPDTDSDADGTADCNDGCPNDPGKIAPGVCGCGVPDDDSDGDGVEDCIDGCPNDPNKTDPGVCGCGVAETGDSDGDGYLDCVDQCPGVDDDVFFPGCQGAIPTVSEWGLVVLGLLLLAGAKVYFGRRTAIA